MYLKSANFYNILLNAWQHLEIKAEVSPDSLGFRVLCPTWWTVRNETFRSVLDNYNALMELWEDILSNRVDSETRARINGVSSQMSHFEFFLGVHLLLVILRHTDHLSKTLQLTKMSASEGQHLANLTVTALQVSSHIYSLMLYVAMYNMCVYYLL